MVGSKVFHTVMPPEGAVVGLRGGIQELEDYLELGDPKGNHSHLIEGMQTTPLAGHTIHQMSLKRSREKPQIIFKL